MPGGLFFGCVIVNKQLVIQAPAKLFIAVLIFITPCSHEDSSVLDAHIRIKTCQCA